jgi:hypothetical protein
MAIAVFPVTTTLRAPLPEKNCTAMDADKYPVSTIGEWKYKSAASELLEYWSLLPVETIAPAA